MVVTKFGVIPLGRLVLRFRGLPNVNGGATRHLTLGVLRRPPRHTRGFTRTLMGTHEGVQFYSIYRKLASARIYSMYDSAAHSGSIVYIITRTGSVVTFRGVERFSNACRILRNMVSPVSGMAPSSLQVGRLVAHLTSNSIQRVVVTAGPAIRNRTATDCVSHLMGPVNVGMAHLTCNIPINDSLRCTSRFALTHTLLNEGRV